MGSSRMDKSSKATKETKELKTPNAQEQASSATTNTFNPDWSGFEGYSPIPTHGFVASGPQAPPYMWGVQHLMPPFGTPPHPYVAMYPPGGIYAHPSIPPGSYPFSPFPMPNGVAETPVNTSGNLQVDGKPSEGKEKLPIKRSQGSLGSLNMITGKTNKPGKTSGASANGMHSKSAESSSEGSSGGSDASSQNDPQMKAGDGQDSGDGSQNGNAAHGSQNGGTNARAMSIVRMPEAAATGVSGPATNLNIGMDYWGAATPNIPAIQGKVLSVPAACGMGAAGLQENVQSQFWLQDEREVKRERRKQSNRESARRSRLRKQAECDELAQQSEALKEENASLRAELSRITSEYEQLLAQNASLKEKLSEASGKDESRHSRNEQLGNDDPHSSEPEPTQVGQ